MPTARLSDLAESLDRYVDPRRIPDFAKTGLQVAPEGTEPVVERVALGVSANLELFEAAAGWGAQAVLVHHGLFWESEDPENDPSRAFDARRAAVLRERGLALLAYHLPLDAHPEVGNNAEIARRLGLEVASFDFGDLPGTEAKIGLVARSSPPVKIEEMIDRIGRVFGRTPNVIAAGPPRIGTMAIVSGGGAGEIYAAIARGLDAYLTGEGREWLPAIAREGGITFFAAGHHASEVFGVQALGRWIETTFGIETRFFPQANPF